LGLASQAWLITNGAPYRAGWERYEQHHDLHALTAAVADVYATDPAYARLVAANPGAALWPSFMVFNSLVISTSIHCRQREIRLCSSGG